MAFAFQSSYDTRHCCLEEAMRQVDNHCHSIRPGLRSAEAKWWNGEWSIRKRITLDLGAQAAGIMEPIGSAAVLIRLHDGNFQFSAAKEDGSDIRLHCRR